MTGHDDWHGLTFNPARGNPSSVGALAEQMTDTSTWLKEAFTVLESVKNQKDTWTGEASKAFADKLGELPDLLDDAHQSLRDAGKALTGWQDTLAAHQRKAIELETEARKALKEAGEADAAASQAAERANQPITYPADDPAAAQAAQAQSQGLVDAASTAAKTAEAAWDRLEGIRRQAHDLQDRWEDDADLVADALENATDIAPGLLDAIGDFFSDMGDWVVDHLGEIGDIAGIISAIAGALAFIPILTPVMGPVALIAGGIALAAHGSEMAVEGKWDEPGAWVGLGADALGMLPLAGPALKGASAATDTLHMVDGLSTAVTTGGKVFLDDAVRVAQQAPEVSKVFEQMGRGIAQTVGGNADTIAKVSQNSFNLVTQVPVAANTFASNDDAEKAADAAGYVSGAGAAAQSIGEWSDAADRARTLGSSLSDFAKAVG